jgi:CRP-like cAMP-binding protein
MEELEVDENELIFAKGDPGDRLYVVVDGELRVHDEGHLVQFLKDGEVFGEMALLDPDTRLASVTAIKPTRLLSLASSHLDELLNQRPEISTGIIRVLTRRLRDRTRDITQLNTRIKTLENAR